MLVHSRFVMVKFHYKLNSYCSCAYRLLYASAETKYFVIIIPPAICHQLETCNDRCIIENIKYVGKMTEVVPQMNKWQRGKVEICKQRPAFYILNLIFYNPVCSMHY